MKGRTRSGKLSLVLLFVCIFAFWWGIAVIAQNGKTPPVSIDSAPAGSSNTAVQGVPGPVPVQVSMSDNLYTYSGSVALASSCEQLGEGVAMHGRNPTHVTILLTLKQQPVDCAQASSGTDNEPFSVSISVIPGSKAVLDGLTVNGIITPTAVKDIAVQ